MVTPRTIIVPLDGSDFAARALPVARAIADRIGAGMIVMSTYWEGGVDGLVGYLDRVAQAQSGVAAEALLVDEHPAAAGIASGSRSHPGSVVCMTTHGRSGARWAILGSVTEDVLRDAHAPVLLVGRHCATEWPSHIEHFVVCVDGSDAAAGDVLAASEWAKALGLDVRVVIVTHPLDVESAIHPNKVVEAITERFVSQGVAATGVVLRGSYVAGTIADFARTLPATLIATGKTSSEEIVLSHLARIERLNKKINAVVTLQRMEAETAARAVDAKVCSGSPIGKLHGVPILIKDSYRVAGVRSTFGGLPQFYRHIPKTDCEQVRCLRAAGAIILGRTNLPLLAFDWQSRNPLFAEAKNPFDVSRTPGGSSGGAAAAVASGFAPLDLGSDLGGSTRYPSHCCGVYGLRTTDGLLPIADLGPESEPQVFERLVTCGPIARTLEDVRLMLEVLTQETPAVQSSPSLRIAVSQEILGVQPDGETQSVLNSLVTRLRADGHQVEEGVHPEIDFAQAYRVHGMIAGHEFARVLPALFKTRLGGALLIAYLLRLKLGNGPFTKWIAKGIRSSVMEYQRALAELTQIRTSTDDFFGRFDLWLLPVSPAKAIKRQRYGFAISSGGKRIPYSEYLGSYLVPTAAMGTPALALPMVNATGFPMAIQIHGKRGGDFQLIRDVQAHLDKFAVVPRPKALEA